MPVQFNFTSMPSMVVGYDLENIQFFHATTRTGALFDQPIMGLAEAILADVVAVDQAAQTISHKFGPKHYVKLRKIFFDDKNGHVTLYVDYLHDNREEPAYTEENIKLLLGDDTVRHFGQSQSVEVSIKTGLFSSDYFSPVADQYYGQEG